MAEKLVDCHIPAARVAGFCWDGVDYEPGQNLKLPEVYFKIYVAMGKVIAGKAPAAETPKK